MVQRTHDDQGIRVVIPDISSSVRLRRSPTEARRLDNSNALSLTKLVVEAITVACFTVNFSDPSLPIYVFTHAHLS